MKPAAFEYHAPRSLDEALALLAKHGGDGRVLAGGQSLVPTMNFRLARPAVLIDINRIDGLSGFNESEGYLTIGTLTRHVAFEEPVTSGPLGRLLPEIAHQIGHLPIRVRGTFGGSLAHADPAAEWCTLALALDVRIAVRSAGGVRTIAAADFFRSIFTTDLRDGEMITAIDVPKLDERWRCGFVEFNRRAGDFAIVSAVTALRIEMGRILEARIALGGVVDKPVRAEAAEKALIGEAADEATFRAAGDIAGRSFEPFGDIHATAEYKAELVAVMTRRALTRAMTA
jgi:aerobic carbon-monoxide dehydrogenase medium subunit